MESPLKIEPIDKLTTVKESIILDLEKHYAVFQIVKKLFRNTEIGLSFVDRLARYVSENNSYDVLLECVRKNLLNSGILPERQEYIYNIVVGSSLGNEYNRIKIEQNKINTNREKILSNHHIKSKQNAIKQMSKENIRPLDFFIQNGFNFTLSEDGYKKLLEVHNQNPDASLVAGTNAMCIYDNHKGLTASASWVNVGHDIFDHAWFSNELMASNLFEKHKDFFAKIGKPFSTDLLSFKGEVSSTIMFAWRDTHHGSELDFGLEGFKSLSKILGWGEREPTKSDIRLGSIWNGVIRTFEVVFMRKAGPLFELDPNNNYAIKGKLNLQSLEFAQLVVDSVALLDKKSDYLQNSCVSLNIVIEDFLQNIVTGKISWNSQLVLRLQDIENEATVKKEKLPKKVSVWLESHPWFDTDWRRREVVD